MGAGRGDAGMNTAGETRQPAARGPGRAPDALLLAVYLGALVLSGGDGRVFVVAVVVALTMRTLFLAAGLGRWLPFDLAALPSGESLALWIVSLWILGLFHTLLFIEARQGRTPANNA